MVTTHGCWRPRMKNGEENAANRRGEWATKVANASRPADSSRVVFVLTNDVM